MLSVRNKDIVFVTERPREEEKSPETLKWDLWLGPAEYRLHNETGPDHQKTFEVEVWLAQQLLAGSAGRSKKEAEQAAARLALEALEASHQV